MDYASAQRQPRSHLAVLLSPGVGGLDGSVAAIADALARRGVRVSLLKLGGEWVTPMREGSPVEVVLVAASRGRSALGEVARWARRERPDVLHGTGVVTDLIAYLVGRRVGATVSLAEHNLLERQLADIPPGRRRVFRTAIRHVWRHADARMAVSNAARDSAVAVAGVPSASVRVIYDPIDPEELRVKSAMPSPITLPDAPFVTWVGRFHEQKDPFTMIRAHGLVRRHADVALVMCGDGPLREDARALAAELGLADTVTFAGHVQNPFPVIAEADVFVQTSRWEGLGRALSEALALRRPMVATDAPGGAREILDDGRFGLLVPPGQPTGIAEAIRAQLEAPIVPDAAAIERFEADHIASEYLDVLGIAHGESAAR